MAHYDLKTEQLKEMAPKLRAGDTVTLTGTVYTARDAAHKKIVAAMDAGDKLPFDLDGAAIYYAGPTPAKPGQVIGSVGPTTSGRMDPFAPRLLDAGLACMIGKGVRGQGVQDAMARNGAVYMVAIGGAGAAKAASIKNVEVIAYDELGCESVKRLTVENFSAIVSQDSVGGNLYTVKRRTVVRLRLSKTSFSEQPLARNHAFERISKKNRVLRTHFFFPCINSEIHKVNCRIAAREGGLGHAPGIYEFAKQIRLNACCRTKHKNRILLFRQAEADGCPPFSFCI